VRKVHVVILSAVALIGALVTLNITGTNSQAIRNVRDCDNNSIIYCGALSQSELLKKYDENKTKDLHAVYAHYGISRDDLAGKTSQVKVGKVYKDGRVEVDGKIVADNARSVGRHYMPKSTKVTIAGKTFYERANTDAFQSSYIDAFVLFRNGQFYRAVLTSCSNPLVAKPTPKPTYSCDSLKGTKITRTEYRFDATAKAANGATISKYHFDFGDGQKVSSTSANVKHNYAKAGTYKIKVSVEVKVGGTTKTVTGPHCETTIKVEEEPQKPVYKCDSLSARLIKLEDNSYEYTLRYTAEGGAMLKTVDYNFGDGTKVTKQAAEAKTVQHAYAKAGTYKTTATLHFTYKENNKDVVKDVKCETSVTISPEMCPLIPSLPKDDPRCAPCPYNPELPKDSPECEEPVTETPPELPKTGTGEIIGGGLGLGALIGAGFYWHASRRSLLAALLSR